MSRHLIHLSNVQRREVIWLAGTPIPRGMLSILAGHPGLGKSLWTVALAARVSHAGGHVIVCSAEDSLEHTIKPRLQAAGADTSCVHALVPQTTDGNDRGVTFPADAALLAEAIAEVKAILAIIDPVTAMLDPGVDSHRDASLPIRARTAPPSSRRNDRGAARRRPLEQEPGQRPHDALGGSIGGPGQARSALLLDRDPDDPEKDRGTRRVLAHFKSNVGPLQPSRLLEVTPTHLPAAHGEPSIDTARIIDLGESVHGARHLLAENGADRTAVAEAEQFLRDELADGITVAAKTIRTAARDAGISPRTLDRAKKRLGVISKKEGFGTTGAWAWTLPLTMPTTNTAPNSVSISNMASLDDDVAYLVRNEADSAKECQITVTGDLRGSLSDEDGDER